MILRTIKAAVLVAGLVLAAGCARQPVNAVADIAARSQNGTSVYQQLIETIYGSAADRLGAEALMTYRIQKALADCMKAAGHDYEMAPSQALAGSKPPVPGDLTTLAPIASAFGLADYKRAVAEYEQQTANTGYQTPSAVQSSAHSAAIAECDIVAQGHENDAIPTGQGALGAQLESVFIAIEAGDQVKTQLAVYADCLAEAGFAARTWSELHNLVDAKFPLNGQSWEQLRVSTQWLTAVAYEKRAAAADAACRGDLHAYVMDVAAAQLRRFASDNSAQLARLATWWKDMHTARVAAGLT